MSLIPLGPGRIQLSRIVMGCMWSGALREPQIRRLIHAACDAGISSFDTAPLYAFHGSEEILGRALSDRRSRVQILTKAGLRWDSDHGRVLFHFTDQAGVRRAVRKDSRPASVRAEVEASLRRLGVEQLDLLQIHHPDIDTPIADTLHELTKLRDAGAIRAIGVSNYTPSQLREAIRVMGTGGLDALQCEYSLVQREPEAALLTTCRAAEVGVLAYSPLAKGTLAGVRRIRDRRMTPASRGTDYGSVLSRAAIQATVALVLRPVASAHGATVDQVALAWLLAQPGLTAAVVGASTLEQIIANAGAMHVTLSGGELLGIARAFDRLNMPLRLLRRLP